jgi:transposase
MNKVTLTMKELKRIHVIHEINAGRMTAKQAAQGLGLSIRQVRRLIKKQRYQGDASLAHGNRGKPSAHKLKEEVRAQILELVEKKYRDYNDSHLTEILNGPPYDLRVSRSTVRTLRREVGLESPRKRRPPSHRQHRTRRPSMGMLVQADGSCHDWLEGRGPWLTLIAFIDDATGEVLAAVFREQEDAAGYFTALQEICLHRGMPLAVYVDRHTIFQSPSKPTVEQELSGELPRSQWGRQLHELGIELILANSPQAKGRIERLFGTQQDCLIKALREAGASTIEEANQVLQYFLPQHNQRFAIKPAQPGSAFMPWPKEYKVKDFFCFKHTRTVTNDNTIPFDGQRLQIPPGPGRRSYAKAKVDVWQHLDGKLEVRYHEHSLVTFEPADERSIRVKKFTPAPGQTVPHKSAMDEKSQPTPKEHIPHKPAANHPWRRYGQGLTRKVHNVQKTAK